ncbi:Chitin deacetylase [Lachnellula subtilissima]|uniref:Chitin deacetylase n=1 Tax=Lachnellula subtilissima TaxID=602034 RepID=A0A8H8RE72_9HELO|nr:Chitin deacetylase [Lachnellula subtilissima]
MPFLLKRRWAFTTYFLDVPMTLLAPTTLVDMKLRVQTTVTFAMPPRMMEDAVHNMGTVGAQQTTAQLGVNRISALAQLPHPNLSMTIFYAGLRTRESYALAASVAVKPDIAEAQTTTVVPAYGQCKTGLTPPPTGNDKCGPQNQGANCSGNQCCSVEGTCGTTSDYCADPGNCLLGYGRCDSDTTPAGPSTVNVARPLKGPVPYTGDIDDCIQDNVVALSFDDGPSIYTSSILDILKAYGYHATFFISGNNNGRGAIDTTLPYPDLIRRMIAEGHQVASHTWSHYSLSNITHDLRISQMVKNDMAFNNIIGMWPTYMRPPYSDCTKESGCCDDMLALGYHRIYFDLDTEDYLHPLPSQIQRSKNIVVKALADKAATDYLSIQHDIVEQSVTNLSAYYFNVIKARGWRGVAVGECLGDTDTSNWYRSFNNLKSGRRVPN